MISLINEAYYLMHHFIDLVCEFWDFFSCSLLLLIIVAHVYNCQSRYFFSYFSLRLIAKRLLKPTLMAFYHICLFLFIPTEQKISVIKTVSE